MSSSEKHEHSVPIWAIFAFLLAFTLAEVGMYVTWKGSYEQFMIGAQDGPYMSKEVMVIVLLVCLTIPKAIVVMIYFMHLKFEKHLIIFLAVMPFIVIPLVFSPPLIDAQTLRGNDITVDISEYQAKPHAEGADSEEGDDEEDF